VVSATPNLHPNPIRNRSTQLTCIELVKFAT